MQPMDDEKASLHSVGRQNAQADFGLRQRLERELILAKEALELKSEEVTNSVSMVWATDESGKVVHFNEQYLRMWRLPRDLMVPSEHGHVVHMMSREFQGPDEFIKRVAAIYQASPSESFDVLELADGRVFERFSRSQFANGKNIGRVWSYRDITEPTGEATPPSSDMVRNTIDSANEN